MAMLRRAIVLLGGLHKEYKRIWVMLPFVVGMLWFTLLESQLPIADYYVEVPLDDEIPFVPLFVVPYLGWYAYVGSALVYFFIKSPGAFVRMGMFLGMGMLVSCCVFALYPNGQMLRPVNPGSGIYGDIIRSIYRSDTSTNSLPSIHVIYSLATHAAIVHHMEWKRKFSPTRIGPFTLRIASFVSCMVICASTVLIKQHSVVDGVAALLVTWVLSAIIYESRILTPIYEALGVQGNGRRPRHSLKRVGESTSS